MTESGAPELTYDPKVQKQLPIPKENVIAEFNHSKHDDGILFLSLWPK